MLVWHYDFKASKHFIPSISPYCLLLLPILCRQNKNPNRHQIEASPLSHLLKGFFPTSQIDLNSTIFPFCHFLKMSDLAAHFVKSSSSTPQAAISHSSWEIYKLTLQEDKSLSQNKNDQQEHIRSAPLQCDRWIVASIDGSTLSVICEGKDAQTYFECFDIWSCLQ